MKRIAIGLATGAASGFAATLAFPPLAAWPLAWVALVPLFLLVDAREGRRLVAPFFAYSLAHFGTGMAWLSPVVTPVGVLLLSLTIWVLFHFPLSLILGFLVRRGLPLWGVAPLAWVAFDWLRTWILTGLPWLFLAHSQADATTVIQVADVTGAFGITALIVLVNGAIAATIRAVRGGEGRRAFRPAAVAAATLVAVLLYGAIRMGTVTHVDGPRVLLVQACIEQGRKREVRGGSGRSVAGDIYGTHLKLTWDGVREHPDTDLVVWPETMFPFRVDDRPSAPSRHRREIRRLHREVATAAGGRPVLFGTLLTTETGESRNSVIQVDADGNRVARYDKRYTVPGGEHVPLYTVMPAWFTKTVGEAIARHSGYFPDLTEGEGPVVFTAGDARFAPLICYEIIYPEIVREAMPLEPQVLLNLSNYAWYPDTHQPEQAEDITIFRAVENRRPVVVSANNGISSIIDARGEVRAALGRDVVGVLADSVPLTAAGSVFARIGDVFAWIAAAMTLLLLACKLYWRRCGGAPT
ncbi:MAG: apolipoprotein N-acyltransferase [Planctomycetota bacterium]